MKVREIMTGRAVKCARPGDDLGKVARLMKENDTGFIPVADEGGRLIGVITDRDIVVQCLAAGHDPRSCKVDSHMTRQVVSIRPEDTVDDAARLMEGDRVRRLPVCEDGKIVGVVSLGDLAVKAPRRESHPGETLRGVSQGVKKEKA